MKLLLLLLLFAVSYAETCFGPQIEYIGAICGSATSCANTANSTFYATNLTRTGSVAGTGSVGWTGVIYSPDNVAHIIDGSNASVLIFDDWVQTGTAGGIVDIYHYNIRISVGETNGVTISSMSGTFTTLTVCSGCTARNLQHEITVWVNAPSSAIGESKHWLMVRVNQQITGTLVVNNFPFDYTYNRAGCGTYCPIYVTSNAVATNIHYKSAVFTTPVDDDYLNLMRWSLGYRNAHRQLCTSVTCPTVEGTFTDYSSTLNTIYTMVLGIDALLGNNTIVIDYLSNLTVFLSQFKIDIRDWLATQTFNVQANFTLMETELRNLSTHCDLLGVSINQLLYGGNFTLLNWKLDALEAATSNVATLVNNGFIDIGVDFESHLAELIKIETILNSTKADMTMYFGLLCSGDELYNPSTGCNLFDIAYNVSAKLSTLIEKSDILNVSLYTLMSTQTIHFDGRFDEAVSKLDLLINGLASLGQRLDSYFYQNNDALAGNVTLLLENLAVLLASSNNAITLINNGFINLGVNFSSQMAELIKLETMLNQTSVDMNWLFGLLCSGEGFTSPGTECALFDIAYNMSAKIEALLSRGDALNVTLYTLLTTQTIHFDDRFDTTIGKLDLLISGLANLQLTMDLYFYQHNDALAGNVSLVLSKIEELKLGCDSLGVSLTLLIQSGFDFINANISDVMAKLTTISSMLTTLTGNMDSLELALSDQTVHFDSRLDDVIAKLDAIMLFGVKIDNYYLSFERVFSGNITLIRDDIVALQADLESRFLTVTDLLNAGFDLLGAWNSSEIIGRLDLLDSKCLLLNTTITDLFKTQTVLIDSRFDITIGKIDQVISGCAAIGLQLTSYYYAYNDALAGNVTLLLEQLTIIKDYLIQFELELDDIVSNVHDISSDLTAAQGQLTALDGKCDLINITMHTLFSTQTVYLGVRFDETVSKIDLMLSGLSAMDIKLDNYFWLFNDALAGNTSLVLDQLSIVQTHLNAFDLEFSDISSSLGSLSSSVGSIQSQLLALAGKCDLLNTTMHTLFASQTIYLGNRFSETIAKIDLLISGLSAIDIKLDNYFWFFNDALAGNTSLVLSQLSIVQTHLNAFDLEFSDISSSLGSLSSSAASIQSQLSALSGKCDLLNITIHTLFATQLVYLGDRFSETISKLDSLISGLNSLDIKLDNYFWSFNDVLAGNVSLLVQRLDNIINVQFPDMHDYMDVIYQQGIDFMSPQFTTIVDRLTQLQDILVAQNSTLRELFLAQTVYLDDRFSVTLDRLNTLVDECSALNLTLSGLFRSLNDYLAQEFSLVRDVLQIIVANIGNTSTNVELVLSKLDLFSPVVLSNFDSLFSLIDLLQNMSSANAINIDTLIAKLDLQNLLLSNQTISLQTIQDALSFLTEKFLEFGISLELGFGSTLYGISQINFTLNNLATLFPVFAENISRIESKIDTLQHECSTIQASFNQSLHELSLALDQRLTESDSNRTAQFLILQDWIIDLEHIIGDRFNISETNLALIFDEFSHLYQLIYASSTGLSDMEDEEMIILEATEAKINQILSMIGNNTVLWEHVIPMITSSFELGNTTTSSLSAQFSNLTSLVSTVVNNARNNQLLISCMTANRCGSSWQWWDGTTCVDNTCFGTWYRSRSVCNGNGVCIKYNTCHCFEGSWGSQCQYR